MKQLFQTCLLITICLVTLAQGGDKTSFGQYAKYQDSIFVSLYRQKDTKTFTSQLNEWITRYNQLPDNEKKKYKTLLARAYYNLACTYALTGSTSSALDYLEKSITAGYADYTHMKSDEDLNSIRKNPRYTAIITPLRAVGDYQYILRKGQAYNTKDAHRVPAFTYEKAEHPELKALRIGFKLDSIAGMGNDVSKVLNLLHWIHELIPHDGNHENPVVKNALSMIAVCKKDSRGLNCRGLATVLNECYLAMGFASRIVTCLPKDSLGIDPDCHVINMVYIPSLNKWIWADPTNDAYVMNETGELLDVREVRERIIKQQPLIVNPTANWNHKASTVKEDYLYRYMAKNLYILQCPVNSTYDMETRQQGKTIEYIQLNPLDYFKQKPQVRESISSGTKLVIYNTNNPDIFWQKP